MTEECFDILTCKQQLVEDWNNLLACAILAETKIRNEIEKKGKMELDEIKNTVLGICIDLGLRAHIERKKGCLILGEYVWESLALMFDHQNKYPEERVEYGGTRSFTKITQKSEDCCQWPECHIQSGLQKDHIIPKSVLSDELYRMGGANWEANGQWLCSFHNRLKTDSILIGILMIRC